MQELDSILKVRKIPGGEVRQPLQYSHANPMDEELMATVIAL